MTDLKKIDTLIVVMMENRSFDHVLGYLSLPPSNRTDVDGLKEGMKNTLNENDYPIFHLENSQLKLPADPPHERHDITMQLTDSMEEGGVIVRPPPYPMNGFVRSFAQLPDFNPGASPMVMGYHTAEDLPAADFFAQQFCICDRWFAPIPTGTQPNRLMAMSGFTHNDINQKVILPHQKLVYDWLTERNIRWRVYHQGIPFFMMMDGWHLKILTDSHFCDFDDLQESIKTESDETVPQVIFIEPRYADAPHVEAPTDDHPPTPIINGQHLWLRIYSDLLANVDRWSRTAMIVTYDEHGGFFDHVSPLPIQTDPPAGSNYAPFMSTGPRVPGLVISPFVKPGSVFSGDLDHTSILKFIAKRFGDGTYSPEVDRRPVGDLSAIFTLDDPREDWILPKGIGQTPSSAPTEPIPLAFQEAVTKAKDSNPIALINKFPELLSHFDDNIG